MRSPQHEAEGGRTSAANRTSTATLAQHPRCTDCSRRFEPGITWPGANFCRAAHLLPIIAKHPGLSTWELSQLAGLSYGDTNRALLKTRDYNALEWDEEERENGEGVRFRYRVVPQWQLIVDDRLHCRARRTPPWV